MRVIVTRPAAQSAAFVQRLLALGVDAVALPLIGIEPPADPAAVAQAWSRLARAALVMFVSANAVEQFFAHAPAASRWPASTPAGSTGPGTTAALVAAGVPADLVVAPAGAGPFDSEALWQRLRGWPWAGRQVLIVRGEAGRDWLAGQLRDAGAEVAFVAAYRRVEPAFDGPRAALLETARHQRAAHLWHFSSSEAIENLQRLSPGWAGAAALATHARIAETARAAGFDPVHQVGVRPEDVADHLRR